MKIRSYSIPYFTLASNIIAEEENELREIFLPISHVHETSFNENDDLVEKEDFDSDEISIRSESDKNGGKDKVPDGLEKSDSTINREVISTSYSKENRNHLLSNSHVSRKDERKPNHKKQKELSKKKVLSLLNPLISPSNCYQRPIDKIASIRNFENSIKKSVEDQYKDTNDSSYLCIKDSPQRFGKVYGYDQSIENQTKVLYQETLKLMMGNTLCYRKPKKSNNTISSQHRYCFHEERNTSLGSQQHQKKWTSHLFRPLYHAVEIPEPDITNKMESKNKLRLKPLISDTGAIVLNQIREFSIQKEGPNRKEKKRNASFQNIVYDKKDLTRYDSTVALAPTKVTSVDESILHFLSNLTEIRKIAGEEDSYITWLNDRKLKWRRLRMLFQSQKAVNNSCPKNMWLSQELNLIPFSIHLLNGPIKLDACLPPPCNLGPHAKNNFRSISIAKPVCDIFLQRKKENETIMLSSRFRKHRHKKREKVVNDFKSSRVLSSEFVEKHSLATRMKSKTFFPTVLSYAQSFEMKPSGLHTQNGKLSLNDFTTIKNQEPSTNSCFRSKFPALINLTERIPETETEVGNKKKIGIMEVTRSSKFSQCLVSDIALKTFRQKKRHPRKVDKMDITQIVKNSSSWQRSLRGISGMKTLFIPHVSNFQNERTILKQKNKRFIYLPYLTKKNVKNVRSWILCKSEKCDNVEGYSIKNWNLSKDLMLQNKEPKIFADDGCSSYALAQEFKNNANKKKEYETLQTKLYTGCSVDTKRKKPLVYHGFLSREVVTPKVYRRRYYAMIKIKSERAIKKPIIFRNDYQQGLATLKDAVSCDKLLNKTLSVQLLSGWHRSIIEVCAASSGKTGSLDYFLSKRSKRLKRKVNDFTRRNTQNNEALEKEFNQIEISTSNIMEYVANTAEDQFIACNLIVEEELKKARICSLEVLTELLYLLKKAGDVVSECNVNGNGSMSTNYGPINKRSLMNKDEDVKMNDSPSHPDQLIFEFDSPSVQYVSRKERKRLKKKQKLELRAKREAKREAKRKRKERHEEKKKNKKMKKDSITQEITEKSQVCSRISHEKCRNDSCFDFDKLSKESQFRNNNQPGRKLMPSKKYDKEELLIKFDNCLNSGEIIQDNDIGSNSKDLNTQKMDVSTTSLQSKVTPSFDHPSSSKREHSTASKYLHEIDINSKDSNEPSLVLRNLTNEFATTFKNSEKDLIEKVYHSAITQNEAKIVKNFNQGDNKAFCDVLHTNPLLSKRAENIHTKSSYPEMIHESSIFVTDDSSEREISLGNGMSLFLNSPDQTKEDTSSSSIRNDKEIDKVNNISNLQSSEQIMKENPITVLCSENFLEKYGVTISELATGQWTSILFPTSEVQPFHFDPTLKANSMKTNGRKILMCDTPLVDESGIDIEIGNLNCIIVEKLSSWQANYDSLDGNEKKTTNSAKSFTRRLINLVSTGRYLNYYILLCVDTSITQEISQDISTLQNALIFPNGDLCQNLRVQHVSQKSLSFTIAEIILSKDEKNETICENPRRMKIIEVILQDRKVQERARFFLSIAPSLTVFGALHCILCYSTNGKDLYESFVDCEESIVFDFETFSRDIMASDRIQLFHKLTSRGILEISERCAQQLSISFHIKLSNCLS